MAQPMIERIARVCAVWADHHAPDAWLAYQGVARLILAQMLEPTKAMAEAPYCPSADIPRTEPPLYPVAYQIMIKAALAEPDQTKSE